uniref:ATP synthase complex subunit 8 n=1 Tax=Neoperla juxtadidita TaxID=3049221 RepID=A0AA95Z8B6_9NEOP|nr:ATPase subunit 8 [Neoperla juxtadidita]
MPQMAPISWFLLFMMFTSALLMFNFLNYYSFSVSPPTSGPLLKIEQNPLTWKW